MQCRGSSPAPIPTAQSTARARGRARSASVDLTAALATAGLVRPGWNTLAVARRGESGRAVTLLVGNTTISAEDFRLAVGRAMGWSHILSTWFEVFAKATHSSSTAVARDTAWAFARQAPQ